MFPCSLKRPLSTLVSHLIFFSLSTNSDICVGLCTENTHYSSVLDHFLFLSIKVNQDVFVKVCLKPVYENDLCAD